MKRCIFASLLLFMALPLHAQSMEQQSQYSNLIRQAHELLMAGDFEGALQFYDQAFEIPMYHGYHLYNAGYAAAQVGQPEKALTLLVRRFETDSLWYTDKLTEVPEFSSLHSLAGWQALDDSLKSRQAWAERDQDVPLKRELERIYFDDQIIRSEYSKARAERKNTDSLARVMRRTDSVNLAHITRLLDSDGWAGKDKVGEATIAYFMVLQHSPLDVQLKYYEQVKQAYERGDIAASTFAMFEDRVLMHQGHKQIYGTQVKGNAAGRWWVHPIEDPANVDKRRADMGLMPIADYLKNWNITWDGGKEE